MQPNGTETLCQTVQRRQDQFGKCLWTDHAERAVADVQAADLHAGGMGEQPNQGRVTLGDPVKEIADEGGMIGDLQEHSLPDQFLCCRDDPVNRGASRGIPEKGRDDNGIVSPTIARVHGPDRGTC